MTDREFAYKRLSENPIVSGKLTFIFEYPQSHSLTYFRILENNIGRFGGTYLINEKDNKIFIRISTVSDNKKLSLVSDKPYDNVLIGLSYLEIPLKYFIELLNDNQFIIEL